ncbi:hypothetical protein RRG08_042555 [Elysia crispata]|uniref:Uncharacterized protein n=1 Tax=Elysia crispata TaxID=231223 RepID=A0AAE1CKA0_9GAST|nr:hypothetical protein RRG08_042555 [Elysia crispata]
MLTRHKPDLKRPIDPLGPTSPISLSLVNGELLTIMNSMRSAHVLCRLKDKPGSQSKINLGDSKACHSLAVHLPLKQRHDKAPLSDLTILGNPDYFGTLFLCDVPL